MTKEEAIKLIDTHTVCFYNEIDSPTLQALHMAIEALHREEAEERGYCHRIIPSNVEVVVRCKDCKNNYNTCTNHGINQPMCDFTDRMLKETDFCSRGERREP